MERRKTILVYHQTVYNRHKRYANLVAHPHILAVLLDQQHL